MTKTMTLAVDVAAYCEVDLPDDTVMTESNLKAIASEVLSDNTYKGASYSFDPDWSTEGALLSDHSLFSTCYDCQQYAPHL